MKKPRRDTSNGMGSKRVGPWTQDYVPAPAFSRNRLMDLYDNKDPREYFREEIRRMSEKYGSGSGLSGQNGSPEAVEPSPIGVAESPKKRIGETLRSAIFEQDSAVAAVEAAHQRITAGLTRPGGPLASMLFLGPTGCGKTELAQLWAKYLDWPLIRFDMSEFSEPHSVSAIVGSPAGYLGSDQPSRLREVGLHKNCVVLLDEIEKAASEVHRLFLQALDTGFITDRSGRKIDFRGTIIIMTTNAASGRPDRVGFSARADSEAMPDADRATGQTKAGHRHQNHQVTTKDLSVDFPPEFLGRIKAIVPFGPLSRDGLRRVLVKCLGDVNQLKGLIDRSLTISLSEAGLDRILDLALRDGLGARPVAGRLDAEVVSLVAARIEDDFFALAESSSKEGQGASAVLGSMDSQAATAAGCAKPGLKARELAFDFVAGCWEFIAKSPTTLP